MLLILKITTHKVNIVTVQVEKQTEPKRVEGTHTEAPQPHSWSPEHNFQRFLEECSPVPILQQ